MTKQAIKNIVGTTCEVRISSLPSGSRFVKVIAPIAGGRGVYAREVQSIISKLHAAGFPEAERGHFANTVTMTLN